MADRLLLTIRIDDKLAQGSDDAYEMLVTVEPGDSTIDYVTYSPADVSGEVIEAAVAAVEDGTYSAEETRALGQTLFNALIKDDIKGKYDELAQPRIRIIANLPEAQGVPWELMHDGTGYVSAHAPFSRGITAKDATQPLQAELPLRVLVVAAFPEGVATLHGQLEVAGIEEAMSKLVEEGLATVKVISGVTVSRLKAAFEAASVEPDPKPYHVLHFIGHGEQFGTSPVLLFEEDEDAVEGRRPAPARVAPEGLLNHIRGDGDADNAVDLRLVFLNACRSVQPTAFSTTGSFAPALLRAGIPAVIGMQNKVFDDVAVAFAYDFYKSVAKSVPIDEALTNARAVAATSAPNLVSDIGVPTLYMRSRTGRLFELEAPPEQLAPAPKPWWQRATQYIGGHILGAVLAILIAAVGGWLYATFILPEPTMESTTFNVAIAEFDVAEDVNRDDAISLSDNLFGAINGNLLELGFTDVWSPEQTGVVSGATPAEREDAAARRADAINADVIVYGRLEPSSFGVRLVPEFYVNDRRSEFGRAGASEITGGYVLGEAETVNPADLSSANTQFAAAMEGRTSALARFVMGLSEYAQVAPDYEAALGYFREAEQISAWREEEGREILYIFIGNVEGRLAASLPTDSPDAMADSIAAFNRAGDAYERSLGIDREYSRAWLGKAEIEYHLAGGGVCGDGIDALGLESSAQSFQTARTVTTKPEHADVEVKADFGLGRVYMCQRLAASPEGGAAEPLFGAVIAAHEAGNDRIVDLAAESHGFLGLLAGIAGDTKTAVDEYRAAADLLARLEGPLAADRSAIMLRNAAFYLSGSPQCQDAEAVYQTAFDRARNDALRQEIGEEMLSHSCD